MSTNNSDIPLQIDDSDPSISYFGDWLHTGNISLSGPNTFAGTTSVSQTTNCGFRLNFSGMSRLPRIFRSLADDTYAGVAVQIPLYGPQPGNGEPIVTYFLDDDSTTTFTQAQQGNTIWYSSPVVPSGSHSLVANVTKAGWTLDYVIVYRAPPTTTPPTTTATNGGTVPTPTVASAGQLSSGGLAHSTFLYPVLIGSLVGAIVLFAMALTGFRWLRGRARRVFGRTGDDGSVEGAGDSTGAFARIIPFNTSRTDAMPDIIDRIVTRDANAAENAAENDAGPSNSAPAPAWASTSHVSLPAPHADSSSHSEYSNEDNQPEPDENVHTTVYESPRALEEVARGKRPSHTTT